MTPALTLRPIAQAEIAEGYEWYEEQRPGLGDEFLREVRRTLSSVEEAPFRYPVIRRDIRRALLNRFPYSILFIAEQENTVVVGCFHARRDPRRWHGRR